jgi:hypothetical protein
LAVACSNVGRLPAGEPCCRWLDCSVPDCIGRWCCDDYDVKCLPCANVSFCFGCDGYCCKRLPCTCVSLCFQCDDYCKKCLPTACTPPLLNDAKCGPPPPCRCQRCCTPPPLVPHVCPCLAKSSATALAIEDAAAMEPEASEIDSAMLPSLKPAQDGRYIVVREVGYESAFGPNSLEDSREKRRAVPDPTSVNQEQQAASLRSFLRSLRR